MTQGLGTGVRQPLSLEMSGRGKAGVPESRAARRLTAEWGCRAAVNVGDPKAAAETFGDDCRILPNATASWRRSELQSLNLMVSGAVERKPLIRR
jgi:hypothetical protein